MRRRILLLVVGMTTLVVLAFAIPLVIFIRNNAYNDGVKNLQLDASQFFSLRDTTTTEARISSVLKSFTGDTYASVEVVSSSKVLGRLPPGGLAALPPVQDFGRGPFGGGTDPDAHGAAPGLFGREQQSTAYRGGQLIQFRIPEGTGFPGAGGTGGTSGGSSGGSGSGGTAATGGTPSPSATGSPAAASGQGTTAARYIVRLYETDGGLHSGDRNSLLLLGGVAIALLIIGVVLGELLTRRIVRPLVNTADTAQRLASGDITARATTDGPGEVADVGRALNRLADRIDELIAEERETVADLSHRLRTPLTALRLDAEALRDADAAEVVGGHVTTLERMLTAVIHAARRPQREGRMPSADATEVVGERVSFWSALAEDQERVATISLPSQPLPVRAGAEDLAAAVDALMENVIAHTPEGTAYSVTLAPTASGAQLVISDEGPGLPSEAAVRGRSDRGSTGLGLDIARRSAESSGGSMTLASSASGGAMVTLDFGTP